MASSGQIVGQIDGIDELRSKLNGRRADLPISRFLDRAAFHLQGGARKKVPVDTGRLKNSIGIESPVIRLRRVGTKVSYGPPVEFGTGPHMPPAGALDGWARRKGLDPNAVAERISIRGTKKHPYMQPAADETAIEIRTVLVPLLASELESAYQ